MSKRLNGIKCVEHMKYAERLERPEHVKRVKHAKRMERPERVKHVKHVERPEHMKYVKRVKRVERLERVQRVLAGVLALVTSLLFALSCSPVARRGDETTPEPYAPDTPITSAEEYERSEPFEFKPGRLLFYEDFNGYGPTSTNIDTMAALGWTVLGRADGAYHDNTSSYKIVKDGNGRGRLYVENNKDNGADSYVRILSENQFGFYHRHDYTLQYDLEYADAGDTMRYITVVNEYDGSFYDSFHFRNGGSGNNQCHSGGKWFTYDEEGEYNAADQNTDSKKTISYKLLGKYYSSKVACFNGISVSVRYVADWSNGNRIYMRVNDKSCYSRGKWVLISKGKTDDLFNPDAGGAAIVLKTGGRQNGYVDNIIVWSGTEKDEPSDRTNPFLTSRTSGHLFGLTDGKEICLYCGRIRGKESGEWLLDGIPEYDGGIRSDRTYLTGQSLHENKTPESAQKPMQLISGTNMNEFGNYLAKLESRGYKKEYYLCDESGAYGQYSKDNGRIYAYFTPSNGIAKVIDDGGSDCPVGEFGYKYDKKPGQRTVLYQYGVPMRSGFGNEHMIDCGMMYVMKLADDSVFVIDGGGYQQFDQKQIDGLMAFLEKTTGAGRNGKIRVSGWFITHTHQDHMAGFCLFMQKYGKRVDVERIFCNLPSVHCGESILAESSDVYLKLQKYLQNYVGDFKFITLHTGEKFNLADVTIRVLYTHEDIVNAKRGRSEIRGDLNNSGTVIRVEFDDRSAIFLADINRPAMERVIMQCPENMLESDIVQMAHHVINDVSELYDRIRARVVLIPQSPGGSMLGEPRIRAMAAVKKYANPDMMFYASEETVGIEVKNGGIAKTYSEEVHGGEYYGNWNW